MGWERGHVSRITVVCRDDSARSFDIESNKKYWEASSQTEEFKRVLPDGGYEASKMLYEQYGLFKNNSPQDKLTITHSDFKADNIYFDFSNLEDSVIVFDWSSICTYRGVADISRLLGTSVNPDVRRDIEVKILNDYLDRLKENGVSDYTFDECWEDYLKG